jgi:hypothetical protein
MRNVGCWNSGAVVSDRDSDAIVDGAGMKFEGRVHWRVSQRVGSQSRESLEELVTIGMRNDTAIGDDGDDTVGLGGAYVCRDVVEELAHDKCVKVERSMLIEVGQREKLLDDALHATGLVADALHGVVE